MHHGLRIAVAAGVAASCGRGDGGPACRDGARELARWYEGVATASAAGSIPIADGLVTLDEPAPAPLPMSLLQIDIRAGGLLFAGKPIAVGDLGRELRAHDLWSDGRRDPPVPHLIVSVSADAPFAIVAAAMAAAADADFREVAFLFASPRATPPPPASALTPAIEAAKSARALMPLLARSVEPCRPLQALLTDAMAGRAAGPLTLAHGLERALTSCGCSVDLDDLRSLLYALTTGPTVRPLRWIGVRVLPPDVDTVTSRIVSAPANATWRDVAPQVIAARGTRVRLVVAATASPASR